MPEHKADENRRLYDGLRTIYKETVHAFAAAIDIKDRYTQGHSVRVGKYSEIIARELGMSVSGGHYQNSKTSLTHPCDFHECEEKFELSSP